MKFFALSSKEGEWGDPTHPTYIPLSGTLQWVKSANAVSRPQLLDVLNSSVGTEQLIYLYAKVYTCSVHDESICCTGTHIYIGYTADCIC